MQEPEQDFDKLIRDEMSSGVVEVGKGKSTLKSDEA